jgi:hypothetical protein
MDKEEIKKVLRFFAALMLMAFASLFLATILNL